MLRFRAEVVVAEELSDLDAYVIVLAERSDGAGRSLEIQRSMSFEAHDRQTTAGAYCLSTESGATHYGGVTQWVLRDESLELHLSPAAARALEVETGFWIDISSAQSATLRAALRRVPLPSVAIGDADAPREGPDHEGT